jgi:hypothetical protein
MNTVNKDLSTYDFGNSSRERAEKKMFIGKNFSNLSKSEIEKGRKEKVFNVKCKNGKIFVGNCVRVFERF